MKLRRDHETVFDKQAGRSVMFGQSADFRQSIEVDLEKCQPRTDQPRKFFAPEALQELADSITRLGQLQPILIRPDPARPDAYQIVAGERRWRALGMIGKTRVNAILIEGDTDEVALVENLQRVDLSPLEEAAGIQALIRSHAYTQEQAAGVLGKGRVYINTTLRLLDLHPSIQAECLTSQVSAGRNALLEIAREPADAQLRLWEQLKRGASVQRLRAARKAAAAVLKPEPEPPAPADPVRLARAMLNVARLLDTVPKTRVLLAPDQRQAVLELRDRLNVLLGD